MTLKPTPTEHRLPMRCADFESLADALDYAAQGSTGCNFYSGRGDLTAVLTYAELRKDALDLARRFAGLNLHRGDRVIIVAETHPDFHRFFFACQYAGLVPVPVAPPLQLGGRQSYTEQLRRLVSDCAASVVIAPPAYGSVVEDATQGLDLRFSGSTEEFRTLCSGGAPLRRLTGTERAYLQYTSGSTRFPRGAMISEHAVLSNLAAMLGHIRVSRDDRCVSWLPFYHDMGLVALMLGPVVAQVSVDYLGTREFAMRPRQWLVRMHESRGTISLGPPFGYELCARRLRGEEPASFDLSAWRLAGVGAELIRPAALARFAEVLAPSKFDPRAFAACYGLAECSLVVTFSRVLEGLKSERVDAERLSDGHEAVPFESPRGDAAPVDRRGVEFVNCGEAVPGHEVEIRDENGNAVPARQLGTIYVRGPSLMSGYFGDTPGSSQVLCADGWLNTGDIGYLNEQGLVITGREKDLIIINGRNVWPQDLEYLAEQEPEVRSSDASAFSVPSPTGGNLAVLVVQCRETNPQKRADLIDRLHASIHAELGIDCIIELVPARTLVRTSSGKLSRSRTREDFLNRVDLSDLEPHRRAGKAEVPASSL